jgi:hypothetical protein
VNSEIANNNNAIGLKIKSGYKIIFEIHKNSETKIKMFMYNTATIEVLYRIYQYYYKNF